MRIVTIVIMVMLALLLAISCGQKVEQATGSGDSFIFNDFASAKAAAAASGKYMVLDFYTDW